MIKPTFLEFCKQIEGYTFHSKKTGYQIYRFEMYWTGLTPVECFNNFNTKVIPNHYSYE